MAVGEKYNLTLIKQAISQSKLNKEQIEAILIGSTLEASLLENTAAELAQATSTNALAVSEGTATAATLGFKNALKGLGASIKSLALAHPILTAIAAVGATIYGGFKTYDLLTVSVEEVKERTDALLETYNSAISEANSNAQTIASLTSRYEKLSKGVNNLGENVSLTADEYAEYNDIVNQIADMFPTMITGYTDEGNAILSLKGNVEELREAYKEAQKEAYNLLIVSGKDSDGNDIITNYQNQVHGNESWLSKQSSFIDGEAGAMDAIEIITRLTGALTPDEFRETYNQLYEEYKNIWNSDKIQEALKSSGFEEFTHVPKWSEITVEDLAKVKYSAQATIQTYNAEIDSQLKNMQTLANAYLMTNSDYEKLDEQSKTAASLLVNSINENIANKFSSKEDVGTYVGKLVASISNNKEAQDALKELFTMDTSDMSIDDIAEQINGYINSIATAINEDPEELKIRLGFDYVNDLEAQYQRAVDFAKDRFNGYDPTAFFQEHSINTQEEIDAWQKIAQGARNAAEAEREYIQSLSANKSKDAFDIQAYKEPIDDFQNTATSLLGTLEKLNSGSFSDNDLTDLFQEFPSLAGKSEELGIAISELIQDELVKLLEVLGENAPKELVESLSSITNEVSNASVGVYGLNQALSTAISTGDQLSALKEEVSEFGAISNATVNSLMTKYPQLTEILTNYLQGYATEAAVIEAMQGVYSQDEYNYKSAVVNKMQFSEEFYQNVYQSHQNFFNGLREDYGLDVENWRNLAQAKASIDSNLIQNLSQSWAKYFRIVKQGNEYAAQATSVYSNAVADAGMDMSKKDAADLSSAKNQANAYANSLNEIINGLNEISASSVPFSGGNNSFKSKGSKGSGSKSEKEATIETFNFIETLISRIQEAISKLKEKAEEAFSSFTSRGKAYAQTLQKVTDEINIQQRAYDAYLARANSSGLDESWASQVRDGSINIADVTDDNLKEQIKQYKDWYEKARECQEQIQELQKTQKELAREKIELLVTKYDKLLSKLKSASDRMQDNISFKEAWGGSGSKQNYADMNKNAKSQITYLIKQSKELKNLQKTVTKGSEAWYEYNERIESNNASIRELTQTMAENAIASASLAKTKAEKKNEKEDDEDKRIDARLDTTSNLTTKNKLISSKIYNINERQNYWKDAYATNQKDRASYGNKILKAKKKDVSKNNKKLFTAAIKSVKSKKLVSTATINGIVAAMKSAKGKEYKELSTLLSYCNYYNANQNAEEEAKLNYEMYALTAQSEKASLREEQLQNRLDANQTHADRSTTSLAETTAAQNRNLDVQTRQNKQNVSSYTKNRKDTTKTREKAGKNANFSSEKSYKKLKNKKLKSRLKAAIAAIKSGKKISKDALKAVKDYCSQYLNGNLTYYYNCQAYNESVENELSAKEAETLAKAEAYAAERQAKLDKASNTVSGRDNQNELYAATAQNQITASGKNAYVDKQSANIAKNLDTYRSTYKGLTTDYNKAKATVKKTSGKDKSSKKIVNDIKTKYVNKNALIPASYIEKAYQVSNSFGLACENYNEALEAKNTAKETLDLYEQTAKSEKAALAMEKMANIEQEYANKQSVYEQRAKRIDSAIDLNQAKGYQTSKVYYDKLMGEENAINQSLQTERTNLTNSLAKSLQDGSIAKYSDEWYEACAKIDAVTNAIDESNLALQEYKNQIQQIEWDNFDYLEGRIKNVASEVSFLADELSRKKLASDDLGWMTDEGNAAAALHAYNYEIYKNQAQDYKKEIDKINAQLSKDPYNKTLLDRRDALVQSYQEVIKSTEDEKYAVIDLYKQGYDALSNKIHNLISDYNDLLDAEKNAYDYQNTIADKTKEIAQIRKQLTAYAGDLSEETRSKVQTLKVSLENAEKELAENQYEKYISDTKDMLSEMQNDFDQSVQEIVDALAENFGQLLSDLDTKTADAATTITNAMTGIGYMPTDEFRKLLYGEETEGNQLPSIATSAVNMLAEMQKFNTNMQDYADSIAKAVNPSGAADDGGAGTGGGASNNGSTAPKPNAGIVTIENPKELKPKDTLATNVSETKPSRTLTELPAKKPTPKQQADSYIKAHLSKTTSKRDKLSDLNKKFYDKYSKKVLSTKEAKELAKLLGVKYDNQKSSGKLYKKLKSLGVKGFKHGAFNIPYDQLAFLGEGADEIQFDKSEGVLRKVGQGDMVFDADKAKKLYELVEDHPGNILKKKFLETGINPLMPSQRNPINPADLLPEPTRNFVQNLINQGNQGPTDVTVNFGDINLPNVSNYNEFRNGLLNDNSFKKGMRLEILGPLNRTTYNSLEKNKYLRR